MTKKQICSLIYEEKTGRNNIEHIRENIKFNEMNIYSDRYYSTLGNTNMQLSKMIKVREIYQRNYENGILKYVEIDGTKYTIQRVANLMGKFISLDLEELVV